MTAAIPRTVLIALFLALISGCTRPVYNVIGAPVVTASGTPAKLSQVRQAILRSGTSLGWNMLPVRPGLIQGRLALRSHLAVVEIDYDARSYDIRYKDSTNLSYDGSSIHKNYNGWIVNLDREIRARLLEY